MVLSIPSVHMGIGAGTVILSLPLILRKVPMNRIYGVRVRLAFGLFVGGFGVFGNDIAPLPTSLWTPV
jgi:hypothetical protein